MKCSEVAWSLVYRKRHQGGCGKTIVCTGTSNLPLNTWTHLAGTYDGSVMRLYVNGIQAGTFSVSGNMATSNSPLRIGGNNVWPEFFSGKIDEIRIYNRSLTQAEIQSDMNTSL